MLVIRLAGIVLGIVTLLKFASDYFDVGFDAYTATILRTLAVVGQSMAGVPLIELVMDGLRSLGLGVADLGSHWRAIHVLSLLLMFCIARPMSVRLFPVAFACAVIPSALAGAKPVENSAVALLPLAGVLVFFAIEAWKSDRLAYRLAALFFVANGAVVVLPLAGLGLGYFVGINHTGPFALVLAIGFIGLLALGQLLGGMLTRNGSPWLYLREPPAAAGFDILCTLGEALAFGYLFAL